MWQPDTGPIAYAIASSDNPKANATPRLPTSAPAITAVPTPPNTSTNVPMHSAAARRSGIDGPPSDQLVPTFVHRGRSRHHPHRRRPRTALSTFGEDRRDDFGH